MPYCNACGKYIREGLLCPYCSRVSPTDEAYPVPDEDRTSVPPLTPAEEETNGRGALLIGEEPGESEVFDAAGSLLHPTCDEDSAATSKGREATDPEASASGEGAHGTAPHAARKDASDPVPGLNATLRRAYARVLDTEDTTDRFSPRDVRAHRTMAALSYLGILWAIPFFFARTSRFVRFHLGQGLLLLLADGIAATLLGLTLLLRGLAPAVSPALAAIVEVIAFLSLLLKTCGITFALRGRARELPLIGSCADAA